MTQPAVQVRDAAKLYASTTGALNWALTDVSLDIGAGEFVCAIGPSGCGKTTLLNLIAGFVQPTLGTVTAQGRPVQAPGPDRGVVFQEYALYPWLSARRNVEFGLRQQGLPAAQRRERVNEMLALTGLDKAADRYPFEMSGGMRQRVAVARALATRPQVLLMDEPFAAIDALTRSALQTELLRIWQELQLSVFFITHNIEEAVFLAQRIVIMSPHPGRILDIVEVDLPYPRDRGSAAFGAVYARVSEAFTQLVQEAG
ncbi:ABC transporter ATP-binding protein [Acidovorax sp. MR-S7]|uniref:ABC transporter ATP-binding protein n=1 Tax=Acidovorax sp. MR-S7 TaxID=1268622 RepID=UPI000361BD99|nr:ABC transporter ATP-binding protein [Acidovorax sp. MR-S7]GAD22775.1 ABC-type nitrate/sulfonate/bicarbonate transport system, ATPase component [Acidovorax sp. MR-S7]